MKLSKSVSDKLKVSRTVEHAVEVRGPEVAEALGPILFPDQPKSPTPAAVIAALGEALRRVGRELEEADLAHADELADDPPERDRRDRAQAELGQLLQRVRGLVSAAYGDAATARVGLGGALPRGHQELLGHARHVAEQLGPAQLGEPTDALVSLDLDSLEKRLRAGADELEDSLEALARESREAQQTLEARDAAAERWSRTYVGVADGFTALASLGGFDELADRIKPTARRRAGRPEPEDEALVGEGEGEASPAPDAGS